MLITRRYCLYPTRTCGRFLVQVDRSGDHGVPIAYQFWIDLPGGMVPFPWISPESIFKYLRRFSRYQHAKDLLLQFIEDTEEYGADVFKPYDDRIRHFQYGPVERYVDVNMDRLRALHASVKLDNLEPLTTAERRCIRLYDETAIEQKHIKKELSL